MSVSTGMVEEKLDLLSLTDDEENEDSDYEPALPELLGILSKWTNYLHGWQDRYIVLKDGTLSYYQSENDMAFRCRGAVSLSTANVIVSVEGITDSLILYNSFFVLYLMCCFW